GRPLQPQPREPFYDSAVVPRSPARPSAALVRDQPPNGKAPQALLRTGTQASAAPGPWLVVLPRTWGSGPGRACGMATNRPAAARYPRHYRRPPTPRRCESIPVAHSVVLPTRHAPAQNAVIYSPRDQRVPGSAKNSF